MEEEIWRNIHRKELTSFRSKVVALEEEARKVPQEASNSLHLCNQLEKEIREEKEQQVKPEAGFSVLLSILLLNPANTNEFICKFFLILLIN